jgi:hypothetical protein
VDGYIGSWLGEDQGSLVRAQRVEQEVSGAFGRIRGSVVHRGSLRSGRPARLNDRAATPRPGTLGSIYDPSLLRVKSGTTSRLREYLRARGASRSAGRRLPVDPHDVEAGLLRGLGLGPVPTPVDPPADLALPAPKVPDAPDRYHRADRNSRLVMSANGLTATTGHLAGALEVRSR